MQLKRVPYYMWCVGLILKEGGLSYPFQFKKLGLKFKVGSLHNILALKEVMIDDDYGRHGVRVNSEDTVIVDIGAGVGDFSLQSAQRARGSRIFAYEPNDQQYRLLQQNIAMNAVGHVHAYKKEVDSLAGVFKELKIRTIDFLKLDCEGAEFKILKDKLFLKKVKKIMLEFHDTDGYKLEKLKKDLTSAGFTFQLFPNRNIEGLGFLAAVRK